MPRKLLRDLFFGAAGVAIAYHEFWVEEDPSPIGAFMVLFLWGLIPAFRAEDANAPSPMDLLIRLLTAGKGNGGAGNQGSRESPEQEREEREAREAREDPEGAQEGQEDPEGKADRSPRQKRSPRPSRKQG